MSLSCADLLVRLQRYAAGFQAHGISPGDRVCVHLGNSVENMVAVFGCIFSGATIVLAKTSLTERERHIVSLERRYCRSVAVCHEDVQIINMEMLVATLTKTSVYNNDTTHNTHTHTLIFAISVGENTTKPI